jgi:ferritin-like metal-binding protein YciE
MVNARDRLVHYLDDAWALEKTLVGMLGDMAKEVNDPMIRTLFEQHQAVTHQHEENLEARLRALGKEPTKTKAMTNQIAGKMGDMAQMFHDVYDKTAQDLMKAYAAEHLEIAMYEAMAAYAAACGDTETVTIARRHMEQEREAVAKIWPRIRATAERTAQAA